MSEQKTVFGICTEIRERSGWITFHIDVAGLKYPVKLVTKKTEVVEAARAVGQSPSTWTYNEVESETVNEHTGKPYIKRYLESVELGGSGSPPPAGTSYGSSASTTNEPPRTGLTGADKDRAITRMACLKAAAQTLGYEAGKYMKEPDGWDPAFEVMKIAQRYEQWVYRDITDVPF